MNSVQKSKSETKEVRELRKIHVGKFKEDMFCSPLNFSDLQSVDQAMQLYHDVLQSLLDKHAPLVSKTFKTTQSPWWNEKCQKARSETRKAQRKLKKNPEDDNVKMIYHEKCIDKAIIIDRARNMYYDQKLLSLRGNSRGTYNIINHLLNKEFASRKLPNGKDDKTVAENFKSYFDKKVKTIYSNIEKEYVHVGN